MSIVFARSREMAPAYHLPDLASAVFLVVDGIMVSALDSRLGRSPGHLPIGKISLDRSGARVRGNLVFEVPAGREPDLELRLYDFDHGHVVCPLRDPPTSGREMPTVVVAGSNGVFEVIVLDLRRSPEWGGASAPDGQAYISLDLLARRRVTRTADGSVFGRDKGTEQVEVGAGLPWRNAGPSARLVAGEREHRPTRDSALGAGTHLLSDVWTGGRLVFLVDAGARRLVLRCDTPASPGREPAAGPLTLELP